MSDEEMYSTAFQRRYNIRVVSVLAALLLGAVLASTLYYPVAGLQYLVTESWSYTGIRIVLLAVFAMMFVTQPPRAMAVRVFLGLVAALLFGVSVSLFFAYEMKVIDALIFMCSAIVIGVEALESPAMRVQRRPYIARSTF